MKKLIYLSIALLTASAFCSCNNEEEDIFGQSAAERLEAAKAEYTDVLTANGGKWLMEYFANADEQGYAFVVTFNENGAVSVSGNNEWIKGFKNDTSLWDIVLDNGPVLTFNTYNKVFHVMSDPADIIGGPVNDATGSEIDETGTGHGGDYEFMIMGTTATSGDALRLKGKKRGISTWITPLAADADDQAILAEYANAGTKMFNSKIYPLYMTHSNGERFVMTTNGKGIFSFYPEAGDAITQTATANAIMSPSGIRFMEPLEIPRANGETITVETFELDEKMQLVGEYEGQSYVMNAGLVADVFNRTSLTWAADKKENLVGGEFANILQAIADESLNAFKPRKVTFSGIEFFYDANEKAYVLALKMTSITKVYFYGNETVNEDGSISFSFPTDENIRYSSNGKTVFGKVASVKTLMDYLSNTTFVLETPSAINPNEIKFSNADNADDFFTVLLK